MSSRLTQEEFIKRSKEIHGEKFNYEFVEFKNVNTKVHLVCNDCGEHIYQTPSNNLFGNGCIVCSGKKPYTTETFIIEAKKIHGDNYDFSETIIDGVDNKIIVICKKCKKRFTTTAYSFLNGIGCTHCNKSTGELRIQRYLDINCINYESEKKFEDCRNIFPLRFDFAILNDDGTVKGLIEFQGKQHYYPIKFNRMSEEKALENFINIQKRDKIKFDYCYTNQIPLLLIRYSDKKNIEIILSQFIRSLDDLLESL